MNPSKEYADADDKWPDRPLTVEDLKRFIGEVGDNVHDGQRKILTRANIEAVFAEHEAQKDRDNAEFASRVELWGNVRSDQIHVAPLVGRLRKSRIGAYGVGAKVPGKFKRRK